MKHVNFNLELKVITPVHIGAGEKYTKLDFVFDPGKQQAGLLHEQRWLRWLSEKGRLEQYTQEMQRQGMHLDNFRWLDQQNYRNPLEQCKDIFVNIIDVDERTSAMNDIVRQVKDVHQCPYIPGSSFKGVLRTAIMTTLIREAYAKGGPEAEKLQTIWRNFSNLVSDSASRLIREIEMIFFKPVPSGDGSTMRPMLSDPFRGLLVSDSQPFPQDSTILAKKHDLVIPAGRNPVSEISLWRESIRPGQTTQFQISLNLTHLKAAGLERVYDAASLIECLRIYRTVVLDNHERILKAEIDRSPMVKQYNLQPLYIQEGYQLLTLGGGVGLPAKSLIYSLAPDAGEARKAVEKMLTRQFRNRKARDTFASPRTIKTTYLKDSKDAKKNGRYRLGVVAIRAV